MNVIGVDPGAGGALSLLAEDGNIIEIADMPIFHIKIGATTSAQINISGLIALLFNWSLRGSMVAYVEQVGSTPGKGAVQMFRFGENFGVLKGVISGLLIPVNFVHPAEWKRITRTPKDKDGARQRACQLFPVSAASFQRPKDDGRAESALIGLYGVRHLRAGATGPRPEQARV